MDVDADVDETASDQAPPTVPLAEPTSVWVSEKKSHVSITCSEHGDNARRGDSGPLCRGKELPHLLHVAFIVVFWRRGGEGGFGEPRFLSIKVYVIENAHRAFFSPSPPSAINIQTPGQRVKLDGLQVHAKPASQRQSGAHHGFSQRGTA